MYTVTEYNHKHHIAIAAKHAELKEQWVGDAATMNAASWYFQKPIKLKAINQVRQGYHCNIISEICTADGRAIDECYTFNLACNPIRYAYEWAIKIRITIADYRIRRNFLKYLCGDNN